MQLTTSVYIPRSSPIHLCHAGVKIILLMVYSVGIFLVDSWLGMGAYAALIVAAAACSKIPIGSLLRPLVPVYCIMAFTLIFNGADPGLFYAARIFFLAFASIIICLTTTPTALMDAFAKALSPLRAIRVPVDDISTLLSLTLRFMPLMATEIAHIRDAQLSRGAGFTSPRILERIKAWGGVFIPLFVGLFRKGDRLAFAMDARCYGMPSVRRTSLSAQRLDAASFFGGLVFVVVLISAAALL